MKRTANAVWSGGLKEGKGFFSTGSEAIQDLPYSFRTRFEDQPGTNPEELIAAAHASCFSMALSAQLGNAGLTADRIETTATVTMVPVDGAPTITSSHLVVVAKVPGATEEAFMTAANDAKKGCPISRVLNTEITMDARLTD